MIACPTSTLLTICGYLIESFLCFQSTRDNLKVLLTNGDFTVEVG